MENIQKFASLAQKSAEVKILKKLIFSKSQKSELPAKITGTMMIIGSKPMLQLESVTSTGIISHENIEISSVSEKIQNLAENYCQINLITSKGDSELRQSKKGKTAVIGNLKENSISDTDNEQEIEIKSHNREKNYILSGSEDFLIGLEISDKNGRVHDKKRAKFRQINRFLELVRDIEDKLFCDLGDETLRICDLCCGKSYLSYAVYFYFKEIKKKNVIMTGVDLKKEVIDYCNNLAKKLNFENLTFICSDINEYQPADGKKPHMVISLHACDIATDIVLEKAAEWETDVILSTPCCHHELNHNIECDELKFITEYSMLRQKLCDAATDALRLLRLKARGYDCEALELIDPEDTPKNIMLRAVRRKNFDKSSKEAEKLKNEYNKSVIYLTNSNKDLKGIKML